MKYDIVEDDIKIGNKIIYGIDKDILDIIHSLEKENQELKDNWNKLKEWIKEYIEANEKWYSSELSNHDKEYYKKDYIDSKFWLMKFQNQMQELEQGSGDK